jgi:putative redox protein
MMPMVEIRIDYPGDLLCQATHAPSQTTLTTDAPVDNQGQGRSFSPTDLVATALGTCIFTVMGIVAKRGNIDLAGSSMIVRKEMTSQPVRRIGCLQVEIHVPGALSQEDRARLENAAQVCPVKRSLHPDIEIPIRFCWAQ